jgi:hypothetical protein
MAFFAVGVFFSHMAEEGGMIPASKTLQATAYDPARPLPLLFGEGTKLKITSAFELHSMMEKGFPSELVIAPAT